MNTKDEVKFKLIKGIIEEYKEAVKDECRSEFSKKCAARSAFEQILELFGGEEK